MSTMTTEEKVCILLGIICIIFLTGIFAYTAGWNKGYIESLVDAKKGSPPKWVITQRDDGTSGWERNTTKEIR